MTPIAVINAPFRKDVFNADRNYISCIQAEAGTKVCSKEVSVFQMRYNEPITDFLSIFRELRFSRKDSQLPIIVHVDAQFLNFWDSIANSPGMEILGIPSASSSFKLWKLVQES